MRPKIRQRGSDKFAAGELILNDSARPRIAEPTHSYRKIWVENASYPPYSPDMSSPDLFPKLKKPLGGKLRTIEEDYNAVKRVIRHEQR